MIPKVIHYCWFGRGAKSELMQKCIASWRKYMPDYEIIEWNEDNVDFNQNTYLKEAHKQKKYAFMSDYVRLKVIYENGGVYLDTDVELIKSLGAILERGGYFSFERKDTIATGLGFAAEAKDSIVKALLMEYENIHFIINDGYDNTPCPVRNTAALVKMGLIPNNTLQKIGACYIYPQEYFCPMNMDTGAINITANTHSIHHYSYSWADEYAKTVAKRKQAIFRVFPSFCAQRVFDIYNHLCKFVGK